MKKAQKYTNNYQKLKSSHMLLISCTAEECIYELLYLILTADC